MKLARYPEVIKIAGEKYNPSEITKYLFELVQLFNDFEESAKSLFSAGDLKLMYDNLIKQEDGDPNKVSSADKKKKAEILTKLVKKLTVFYRAYVKSIANKPSYKRYIGGVPMFQVHSTQQDPAKKTPGDLTLLQSAKDYRIGPMTLSGSRGAENIGFSLDSLQTKSGFMKLLTQPPPYGLGYPQNVALTNSDIQKKVLSEINAHIEKINQQLRPAQTLAVEPQTMQVATGPTNQTANPAAVRNVPSQPAK